VLEAADSLGIRIHACRSHHSPGPTPTTIVNAAPAFIGRISSPS
jgi:hypothetical protein